MDGHNKKRTYIRRKRCLSESQKYIEQVLIQIYGQGSPNSLNIDLKKVSMDYASNIEALCWSPRLKISDMDYHSMIKQKTRELCNILLQSKQGYDSDPTRSMRYSNPVYRKEIDVMQLEKAAPRPQSAQPISTPFMNSTSTMFSINFPQEDERSSSIGSNMMPDDDYEVHKQWAQSGIDNFTKYQLGQNQIPRM